MRSARMLAALVAALMAVSVAAVLSDASEADVGIGNATASGFSENHSGTVEIPVTNGSGETVTIVLTATYADSGEEIDAESFDVAEGSQTLKMSFRLPSGTQRVTITASGEDVEFIAGAQSTTLEIDVEASLWSSTTTYVAVILVAIVIVIAVVIYLRGRPKEDKKSKMTFTELEAQKKSGTAAKPEEGAPSTQRRRYSSDAGAAKAEAPSEPTHVRKSSAPKEENEPTTFTELEARKKAKDGSDGSKKLKYKSS